MPNLPSTPPPPQENKTETTAAAAAATAAAATTTTTTTTVSETPVAPSSNATGALSDNPSLVPRKCHLRKWADYEGYGFNLHADKANNLHFIGEVDEGSPAKLGGLRPGDRLVEVNGVNIDKVSWSLNSQNRFQPWFSIRLRKRAYVFMM